MISPIKHINVVQIIEELTTEGSAPLYVLCDDGNDYFIKSTKPPLPYVELINELMCAYMLIDWELKVPDFAIAHLSKDVVVAYETEKKKLSERYSQNAISIPFFASRKLSVSNNLEKYNSQTMFSKRHFDLFKSPLDLIKIGLFDLWVGNKDRRPENPNILISGVDSELEICPIDHTAAFAHCDMYRKINETFLFLENRFRILTIPLIKSIANFGLNDINRANFEAGITNCMERAVSNLPDIFEQTPPEWGLNKKDKAKLVEVLTDKERNNKIVKSYLGYIK